MTRNQRYEASKKAKGLIKITSWIPEAAKPEFIQIAAFCCEHPEYMPFMVRSTATGKLAKGV